jgi:hypothetical protein
VIERFLGLFKSLIRESIPNKAGNFGVSNRISRKIYFGSMLPFININHFRLVPLKNFKVKYSKKKPPYSDNFFYQFVWTFDVLEVFETFILL